MNFETALHGKEALFSGCVCITFNIFGKRMIKALRKNMLILLMYASVQSTSPIYRIAIF